MGELVDDALQGLRDALHRELTAIHARISDDEARLRNVETAAEDMAGVPSIAQSVAALADKVATLENWVSSGFEATDRVANDRAADTDIAIRDLTERIDELASADGQENGPWPFDEQKILSCGDDVYIVTDCGLGDLFVKIIAWRESLGDYHRVPGGVFRERLEAALGGDPVQAIAFAQAARNRRGYLNQWQLMPITNPEKLDG